jgi:glycosyltransferase involved in cell wall biosynthesis
LGLFPVVVHSLSSLVKPAGLASEDRGQEVMRSRVRFGFGPTAPPTEKAHRLDEQANALVTAGGTRVADSDASEQSDALSGGVDSRTRAQPLIAVAMATFNPKPDLLERQVQSISDQTHGNFVCLVSDDASDAAHVRTIRRICNADRRFVVQENRERVGFYRNFERCLSLVPSEADYVALCDQDDVWHQDKLETLHAALVGENALLAYCDMNIVTEKGVLSSTYWSDRRNNYTDLASLILANTITGAASLFRRQLLDHALPFPPQTQHTFHDHWIACLALALGRIAYVPRPLHDYVRHGANVVSLPEGKSGPDDRGGALNALRRLVREPRRRTRSSIVNARTYYEEDVRPRQLLAENLLRRLDSRMGADKEAAVRRIAAMTKSPASLVWLLGRSIRDPRGESETHGAEIQLAKGVLWHWQNEARGAVGRLRPDASQRPRSRRRP